MINIPAKAKTRISIGLKKFQPILNKARSADINESDTVTIIADMLSDILGYDKYSEVTSEFAIKKTFCDLAIKLDNKIVLLIECKAIGLALKEDFVRQATNYSADSGTEWVVLTNGVEWKVFKIIFSKPIEKELVYEFDITTLNPKKDADLEILYYLCRESFTNKAKNSLEELHTQKQILNKFVIGQLLMTDTILDTVRKQVRKISNDIKVDNEYLKNIINNEIIKREILDGEQAIDAKKRVQKMERAQLKNSKKVDDDKDII